MVAVLGGCAPRAAADQRHEADRTQIVLHELFTTAFIGDEALVVEGADRDDEATMVRTELRKQRFRDAWRAGGDQNTVIRGGLLPTLCAVSDVNIDVRKPQCP